MEIFHLNEAYKDLSPNLEYFKDWSRKTDRLPGREKIWLDNWGKNQLPSYYIYSVVTCSYYN